ncbi:MAG: nuclear transport factor 2 family protein [Alphaproteobacteria bacterium]|nr:nuclear transport factor 2 family protein [Alphaproteobacteria bacterium]
MHRNPSPLSRGAIGLIAGAALVIAAPGANAQALDANVISKAKEASMQEQDKNKTLVRAGFERWAKGTGSPFELLAPEAEWTIVGTSPLSKTYTRQQFMDEVIGPFNARMTERLVPTVRGIYADGDMVIALFDAEGVAKDGQPYRNTYTWYFQMRDGVVFKAIAFFDVREFDDFWTRVSPTP